MDTSLIPEAQTCPRRMQEVGPWDRRELLDAWVSGRWTTDEEADRREIADYEAKHPGSICGSSLWKWAWGPPRTCDFCGGIHPEDAIRLVSEGWEVGATTKGYKRYLNPPGERTRHEAFLASCRDPSREPGQGVPSVWSPTPPVKLYVMHFDEDQVRRFNEALAR